MKTVVFCIWALTGALVLFSSPALAVEPGSGRQICIGATTLRIEPDDFIAACTAAIDYGGLRQDDMVVALSNRALMYITVRKYDLATADCERATALNANYPFAYYACGEAYAGTGQYDRALAALDKAIRHNSLYFEQAHVERGVVLAQTKQFAQAFAEFDDVLRHKPGDAHALYERGNAYVASGQLQTAIDDFDAALRTDPQNESIANARARAHEALAAASSTADAQKAAAATAAQAAPETDALWKTCSSDPGAGGDNDRRIDACTKIIDDKSAPNTMHVAALKKRGYLYAVDGKMALTTRDYEEASTDDIGNPHRYFTLGNIEEVAGRHDLALSDFDAALKLDPDFMDALQRRCEVRAEIGMPAEGALADCNRALQIGPGNIFLLQSRGRAYIAYGQYQPAIADFDAMLQIDPNSNGALVYRCQARAEWGQQLDQALADCNRFLDKANFVDAFESRALIYYRLKQDDNAIKDANSSIDLNPRRPRALYLRGLAKMRMGEKQFGQSDIWAAEGVDPKIDKIFASFGIVPPK